MQMGKPVPRVGIWWVSTSREVWRGWRGADWSRTDPGRDKGFQGKVCSVQEVVLHPGIVCCYWREPASQGKRSGSYWRVKCITARKSPKWKIVGGWKSKYRSRSALQAWSFCLFSAKCLGLSFEIRVSGVREQPAPPWAWGGGECPPKYGMPRCQAQPPQPHKQCMGLQSQC